MTGQWQLWLGARAPRERRLLNTLATLFAAALLWWVSIAPALHTYQTSSAVHSQQEAELAQMQSMADEAKHLRAMPRMSSEQARAWAEGSIKKLGKASMSVQAGRIHINFVNATPQALALWLAQARISAQLLPTQANWRRSTNVGDPLWSGSLVMVNAGT